MIYDCEKSSPLISIIIPVYKVEKYLDKCIASVVDQTYKNLEIILVDDGSPDNCPAICDQWQGKDNRIKVIHQWNNGLSVARNEGLKLAHGECIGFVDSDDWIESEMYEKLLSALQETDADIAVGGFEGFTEDSKPIGYIKTKPIEKKLYSAEEALRMLLKGEGFICNNVWNKLYRRTTLLNITFPKGKLYEDVPWTAEVIGNSQKIVCIDYIFYHYLSRPNSLSHDVRLKISQVQDKLEMFEERVKYVHEYFPALDKFGVLRFQNLCCRKYLELSMEFTHLDRDGTIRNDIYNRFCQYSPYIFLDKQDIVKGFARFLFWISPNLLLKAYKLVNMFHQFNAVCFF